MVQSDFRYKECVLVSEQQNGTNKVTEQIAEEERFFKKHSKTIVNRPTDKLFYNNMQTHDNNIYN